MKMTLATGKLANNKDPRRLDAFTLVELILVMALLVMVVSIIGPRLSRFFAGRKVDLEVKRVVSLMHYGRSRAVSEGVPMMLWVDARKGAYGLEQEPGFTGGKDTNAVQFTVDDSLTIDFDKRTVVPPPGNSQTGRILSGQVTQSAAKKPAIYFQPDGIINTALSVSGISIRDANNPPVWIVPSTNQLNYEVQSQSQHAAIRH